MKLLQVDFPMNGPFGEEMAKAFKELAEDIAKEEGLIWKIWTENKETQESGGIYLFKDEANAQRYLLKHSKRLQGLGIKDIRAKIYDVNRPLSEINKAPFGQNE